MTNKVSFFSHETTFVDDHCEIGAGTKIWHFSHILSGCQIGKNCNIGQNVMIGPNVIVGDNCKVQNNVSIYDGVTLEDGVFCGPSMVFTNVINPRAEIERKDEFLPTLVRRGASIGANSTIICGNKIGRYAFVGAGSVVVSDVPDYAIVVGNPAKKIGDICVCGIRLQDGDWGSTSCSKCGRKYSKTNNIVAVIETENAPDDE